MSKKSPDWYVFKGNDADGKINVIGLANDDLPPAPPWRTFGAEQSESDGKEGDRPKKRGETFQVREHEKEMINAALFLRRPLLITGNPGTGKSSLAYAVAHQLELGEVLYWPITTRTTLKDGLYNYDAIARLQDVKDPDAGERSIGDYIRLGPLGTALLPSDKPRVLIIDEIDKSDIDLPNDLLTVFEEGKFIIPELERLKQEFNSGKKTNDSKVWVRTSYSDDEENTKGDRRKEIKNGLVSCTSFPFIVLTSNGERDFPAPFLRRCLRLTMENPTKEMLTDIVKAHFKDEFDETKIDSKLVKDMIKNFHDRIKTGAETLATDQLLNAVYMVLNNRCDGKIKGKDDLVKILTKDLGMVEGDFE
ncbi:ATPase associated with various cellular activities AAA_5 [[Leptolyngbya] sp. PCC 7376]|uniref:AAA family ATPase n=1 Tax=[Leptolyngbya] sp. PCC 7376 TaxID=111781 RepID=UPI00029F24FA|nr:MoxR family ATPase [[Leptolyngbya] sp. PCC 7376]AFY39968.1 ATPase associated with various cellular activities AAA_5 [[Leptolyngbya] sp. PCC 7376]